YPTLTTAIDDAPQDNKLTTINLLADTQAESYNIPNGKNITLNIGNHYIDTQFGFRNFGSLTVKGTEESLVTARGNNAIFDNYATLNIAGGTYNNISSIIGESDYRRCVWTAAGSETKISDGTFEAPCQVVCANGKLTIESGTFTCTGNYEVVSNYNTASTITINGGTFLNCCPQVNGTDYRRCVWTTANSETKIRNGDFKSIGEVICTNGRMIIESGTFTSTGNHAVLNNYCTTSTMIIIGGTSVNCCPSIDGTDYRRCVWTKQGSNTFIGHVFFENQFGQQTLCFNGNASINGADINNTIGYGCLAFSGAKVVINDCRLSAPYLFYVKDSNIECRGGLYSEIVGSDFLNEGYKCVANTQEETKYKYPYIVQEDPTGIASPLSQENQSEERFYNTQGILQPSLQKGVNIIRYPDGTTRKVLNK
ncbi:MAG: hypothetical protein J5733_02790, partial [Bacteroidaceae bacterium]|nr:hypothetical protein [Bacteroidaceae bacterium]